MKRVFRFRTIWTETKEDAIACGCITPLRNISAKEQEVGRVNYILLIFRFGEIRIDV